MISTTIVVYVFLALILKSPSILLQFPKVGPMLRPLPRLPHLLLGTLSYCLNR